MKNAMYFSVTAINFYKSRSKLSKYSSFSNWIFHKYRQNLSCDENIRFDNSEIIGNFAPII